MKVSLRMEVVPFHRNRSVDHAVTGAALKLKRDVVPAVDQIAGHGRRRPLLRHVVRHIPPAAIQMIALSAEEHADSIDVHTDIEFEHSSDREVRHIEVRVIGEVMQAGDQGVTYVRRIMR